MYNSNRKIDRALVVEYLVLSCSCSVGQTHDFAHMNSSPESQKKGATCACQLDDGSTRDDLCPAAEQAGKETSFLRVSVVLQIVATTHLAFEHGHACMGAIAKNRTSSSILTRISNMLAAVRLNSIKERVGSISASTMATVQSHRHLRWMGWGNPAISIGPITRWGGNTRVRMRRKSRAVPRSLTNSSIDRGCSLPIDIPAGHRISRTMTFASSWSSRTLMMSRCWSEN